MELDYKRLFEASPAMVLVLTPEFDIVAATDAYLTGTQMTREYLLGKNVFEAFPENPDEVAADGASRLRASLTRVVTEKVQDALPLLKYDVAVDGGAYEEKYWSPINTPVLDEHGNVSYIMNMVVDITDYMMLRKNRSEYEKVTGELEGKAAHMEGELFLRSQQLQAANEKMGDANKELRTVQESLQNANEELQASEEELKVQQEELQILNTELQRNNDTLEKAMMALGLKAEELERASTFKSDFLSNMSHELRTPLNSMLILSKLLGKNTTNNLTPKQVTHANVIHSAGNDLLNLINDILDLSKIESGKMDMVMERTYVEDIAMSIQSIFAPIATQKGIDFKVDVAPGTPEVIQTDKFRLEQVLKNFLSNAFKFTPAQGSVQLLIGRGPDPQTFTLSKLLQRSAGIISFAVKDTGIGIAADKQADIFVAFRQADGSTSRKYGGTGLGLSISRQLAGLLGGEIRLESEPGKGSTFALFVPAGFTV